MLIIENLKQCTKMQRTSIIPTPAMETVTIMLCFKIYFLYGTSLLHITYLSLQNGIMWYILFFLACCLFSF